MNMVSSVCRSCLHTLLKNFFFWTINWHQSKKKLVELHRLEVSLGIIFERHSYI